MYRSQIKRELCLSKWVCLFTIFVLAGNIVIAKRKPERPAKRPELTNEQRIRRNKFLEDKARKSAREKEKLIEEYAIKQQKLATEAKRRVRSRESEEKAKFLIAKAEILTAYSATFRKQNLALVQGDNEEYKASSLRLAELIDDYERVLKQPFPDFDALMIRIQKMRKKRD